MIKHLLILLVFFLAFSLSAKPLFPSTTQFVTIAKASDQDEDDFEDEEDDFEDDDEEDDFEDDEDEDDFEDDEDEDEDEEDEDEDEDEEEEEDKPATEDVQKDLDEISLEDEEENSEDLDKPEASISDEDLEEEFEDKSTEPEDTKSSDKQAEEFLESTEEAEQSDKAEDKSIEEEFEEQPSIAEDTDLNIITNIRYVSEEDKLVIDTSQTVSYQTRKNVKNNQLILEILQAKLMDNLKWPFVLKDFKTNFGLVQADQKEKDTVRIVIQLKKLDVFPEASISESGDQIVVSYPQGSLSQSGAQFGEKLTAKTLEDVHAGRKKFSGSPISLHVSRAPVQQVLKFISEESGLNMVISDRISPSETVSMKLENVPWDQALMTVLKIRGLAYERQGNVVVIAPTAEVSERYKQQQQLAERQIPLRPFKTEAIPVSFSKTDELQKQVESFLSPAINTSKNQRAKGKVIAHKETNTLIVIDTAEVIENIREYVKHVDLSPRQVMVEARIVNVTEGLRRQTGINWDINNSLPINISAGGFLDFLKGNFQGDARFSAAGDTNNFRLNLGNIPIIGNIGATLNLLEGKNLLKVISSPKVVAISGQEASISSAQERQIASSVTRNQANPGVEQQTLEKDQVKVELKVTPTITPSGSVFLTVDVTKDDSTGPQEKITNTAKTQVLVKNGHTIVIGGIHQHSEIRVEDGFPLLNNIPFVRWIFGSKALTTGKTELIVFLTPRILQDASRN